MKTRKKDLTTGEIARYCQVTHFTVTNWITAGKLRAYRTPGGHHRVQRDDFLEFLTTYKLPIPEEFILQNIPRILVVDDEQALVEILTQTLQQAGYQIDSAADGYEAGLKMATFKPDLLVVDLVMPRINGFELCTKVKADPLTQGVKIIAITGYAEDGNIEKVLAAGADTCLKKPFPPHQLLQEIQRLLYRTQRGNGEAKGLERRKTRRAELILPIHYTLQRLQQQRIAPVEGKGKSVNIGCGGLLLETALPLYPSNLLTLTIALHRGTPPIFAEGEVRWVKPGREADHQVGVQFTYIAEHARAQLAEELFVTEQSA